MVTPELLEGIKKSLTAGKTAIDIEREMSANNWSREDIDTSFTKLVLVERGSSQSPNQMKTKILRRLGITLIFYLIAIAIVAVVATVSSDGYWYTIKYAVSFFLLSPHLAFSFLVGPNVYDIYFLESAPTIVSGVLINTLIIFIIISVLDHYNVISRYYKTWLKLVGVALIIAIAINWLFF